MTPPDGSVSTVFVFDLPEGVRAPSFKVRGETLMGRVFDAGQVRKVKIGFW